jgi:hypothetical protein
MCNTKNLPLPDGAQELLKQQYAAVGASAHATLADELDVLQRAAARGLDVGELLSITIARSKMVRDYIAAFQPHFPGLGEGQFDVGGGFQAAHFGPQFA